MTEEEEKVIEYWAKMTNFADDMMECISNVADKHSMNVEVHKEGNSIILTPVEKKEEYLPVGTPCMCSMDSTTWILCNYYGRDMTDNWKEIIPFDKFDPNNIEESLKHNIVNNGNH